MALLALGAAACVAPVGTSGLLSVPKNAGTTCAEMCSSIGMSLTTVVVMANNVGCACAPPRAVGTDERGVATAAGLVAAQVQEAERQAQQQARQP